MFTQSFTDELLHSAHRVVVMNSGGAFGSPDDLRYLCNEHHLDVGFYQLDNER